AAHALESHRQEEMTLSQVWIHLERFAELLFGSLHITLLNHSPCHIYPAVGIARVHLSDFVERCFGSLDVALKQQAYSVVIPPFPHRFVQERLVVRRRRVLGHDIEDGLVISHHRYWDLGNALDLARYMRCISGEYPFPIVMRCSDRWAVILRISYSC